MTTTQMFKGKKGMEMWQLVILILAILFLLAMVSWYAILNKDLGGLLESFSNLF